MNETEQFLRGVPVVRLRLPIDRGGFCVQCFQIHQPGGDPPLAHDMRCGDIVRDAADPGPECAAAIEQLQAAPKLKMNVLQQIAPQFRSAS